MLSPLYGELPVDQRDIESLAKKRYGGRVELQGKVSRSLMRRMRSRREAREPYKMRGRLCLAEVKDR